MTDFGRRCLQDEAFNEVYQEVKKTSVRKFYRMMHLRRNSEN